MPTEILCQRCGQRPAAVHIVFEAAGRRGEGVLCAECAVAVRDAAPGRRPPARPQHARSPTPALDEFGRDLTADALAGRIDPVIGRDAEIEQAVEVLARRRKNNAVLIGEPGVGKTAVAEGLALRFAAGDVPETLRGARLVALDLAGMVAGAQYRGQFEERLKTALAEAADSDREVVLFIDELHTVLGAGGAEGAMGAGDVLKPLLARGEVRVVGATTLAEFRRVERDGALARRFSTITVGEPSVEDAVAILRGLREAYEAHHDVTIEEAALEAAARLSDRYLTELRLPDKAIDLIDQAAARVRLRAPRADGVALREQLAEAVAAEDFERAAELKRELDAAGRSAPDGRPTVGEREVAHVIAARTGIPVGELVAGELERLAHLEDDLRRRVVGQDHAIEVVADTVRRARVGLSEGDRPLGTFLFLGPTGVGKTELVKALAERLFATEKALVRIDMSEFRQPHTVARLIGSPPGYIGYGDGGQLTEPVRRRPYSVVLLDEVEKAHPAVWDVLLQLMDDGRLTDGEGRTVDFTNTVVVMTSNLGAGQARRSIGFAAAGAGPAEDRMLAAVKDAFLPEFLNRIDEVVTFSALGEEQVVAITRMVVDRVAERLRAERDIALQVDDALVERLARDGFDAEMGARPLQRHVRRTLERALTRAIVAGELADGAAVRATPGEDGAVVLAPVVAAAAA